MHTWTIADPPTLAVPRNLALGADASNRSAWPITGNGTMTWPSPGTSYDGVDVSELRCVKECRATILAAVDLGAEPAFAGQLVYVALQARIATPSTGLTLYIDPGDGTGWHSSSDWYETAASKNKGGAWRLFAFEATLAWSGHAGVALGLFGEGEAAAELGRLVIGPAGADWSRLQ